MIRGLNHENGVEACRFPSSKKGKGATVSRKGHNLLSVFFLRLTVSFLQITFQRDKPSLVHKVYYSNLLDKLRVALKNKRRGMLSRGIRHLSENAPPHSSRVAVDKARACGFGIVQHQPYSPDLAPRDFFLLAEMENPIRGVDLTQMTSLMKWESDFKRNLQVSTITVFGVSKTTGEKV